MSPVASEAQKDSTWPGKAVRHTRSFDIQGKAKLCDTSNKSGSKGREGCGRQAGGETCPQGSSTRARRGKVGLCWEERPLHPVTPSMGTAPLQAPSGGTSSSVLPKPVCSPADCLKICPHSTGHHTRTTALHQPALGGHRRSHTQAETHPWPATCSCRWEGLASCRSRPSHGWVALRPPRKAWVAAAERTSSARRGGQADRKAQPGAAAAWGSSARAAGSQGGAAEDRLQCVGSGGACVAQPKFPSKMFC